MTFTVHELEDGARVATGLDDFGSPYYREGLERTVDALNNEADLNELGGVIQHATISNALIQRLRIVDTYKQHPEIADEVIEGPVFVIGLPRTGTTALSQLVANDPQFRSLRMWESQACTPPPEAETQHDDPRIAAAAEGLAMMDNMFPRMRTMMNSEPQAATECQDLMGMSFRTFHFDGVVRVPGYLAWLMQCDMAETYTFHRQVLKLLQWHCPPNLWHLKTPVHMFSLDALVAAYPNAKFLWSHRDPAKVLASVCSLIQYVRSWSSDRDDAHELGAEQLACWAEGVRRAMDFRKRLGDNRFVDVSFADLNADPLGTLEGGYDRLGLDVQRRGTPSGARVGGWASARLARRACLRSRRLWSDTGAGARVLRRLPRDLRRDRVMESVVRRRRKKLDPDPGVRDALVNAAAEIVRDEGIPSVNIARVLERAGLSTRAFYRHFDSKDSLVSAVFLQMARIETRRLKRKMAATSNPVDAVVAWIDGRLDLAFDDQIRSDQRQMSLEALTQMSAAPELVGDAYGEILKPLVEQLEKGRAAGLFPDIDPEADALSIHGALWASVERQWATGDCDRSAVREQIVRFCIRGLGVVQSKGW